jgi:type IV secretory pathway VirJ component
MIRGLAAIAAAAALCVVVQRKARRGWLGFAVPFAGVLIAAAAYLRYIGYLGGPIVTVFQPAPGVPQSPFAVMLMSGDMGNKVGMGGQLIARLTADGTPVVAVNTLRAFRTTQTPARATALIAAAAGQARALVPSGRIMLVGQSFGGDMLQVGLAKLPAPDRRGVAGVMLVVPGDTVDFRASPSELFALGEHVADALPTARLLGWAPTLCIWGVEETDSLCPKLNKSAVRVVGLPGGHPLRRDADRVHAVLTDAFARAMAR